ncbi:hypothetical protein FA13DRAFT_1460348 [Coprinellus micaceus]|uniref:Uncharacterized protein n=1 Tax=Coprinellus micaceus TaxID=71717 RepID=A0A4Y7SMN1_COPMI|nr:hypothetical protein FA13DRAFT_1460348 [Coprinellus micaceus]
MLSVSSWSERVSLIYSAVCRRHPCRVIAGGLWSEARRSVHIISIYVFGALSTLGLCSRLLGRSGCVVASCLHASVLNIPLYLGARATGIYP